MILEAIKSRAVVIIIALAIICAVAIAGIFLHEYFAKQSRIDALQRENAAIKSAQAASEATINQLRQDNDGLLIALEKWKKDYADMEKASIEAKQQIKCLEDANEEIRATLHMSIPDDVWAVMFPQGYSGPACANQN